MRKLNFLLGALGGIFGGLLLTNKKLRKDLRTAEDPSEAAKILGKELHRGGKEMAKEAKLWLESEKTQKGIKKWKHYLGKQWQGISHEAEHIAASAAKSAKHKAEDAYEKARETIERKMH
jgi:hypothetical protein